MPISNAEAFDMLAVYFECFQNAAIASRVYAEKYPDRHHYDRRVFTRIAKRLQETGSVHRHPHNRRRISRSEANIINVLAYVEIYPHMSIRQISRDLGICRTIIHKILKEHKLVFLLFK